MNQPQASLSPPPGISLSPPPRLSEDADFETLGAKKTRALPYKKTTLGATSRDRRSHCRPRTLTFKKTTLGATTTKRAKRVLSFPAKRVSPSSKPPSLDGVILCKHNI